MAYAIGINLKAFDEAGNVLFVRYCKNKQDVRHVILHDNGGFFHRIAYIEYRHRKFTLSEVYSKFPIGYLIKKPAQRADIDG